tara:strand:+ start:18473 stop:18715 length:243 start_codon:yes stop_codon:yes gene_type:complete
MSQYLSDPDYLFSILTALVKKNGGQIVLSEKELQNISKGDLIGMYYEPKTGNLVLKEVEPEDMLLATDIVTTKKEDKYDN